MFLRMDDVEFEGKAVILRVDLHSVVSGGSVIPSDKVEMYAETMNELANRGAKVVVIAHQGRRGRADFIPLEEHARLLRRHVSVEYVPDITGRAAREAIERMESGDVILLENLCMHPDEDRENRTPEEHARSELVRTLAARADFYVNDAFSVCHRSYASVVGFPRVMKSYIGRVMERELRAYSRVLTEERHPRVWVFGGVKVEEALDAIDFALKKEIADVVLTTGVIASTFICASGASDGLKARMKGDERFMRSVKRAKEILNFAGERIEMPVDVAVEDEVAGDVAVEKGERRMREEVSVGRLKKSHRICDIGEKTCREYVRVLRNAGMIVVKGPAGVWEKDVFTKGTREILRAISYSNAPSIICGRCLSAVSSFMGLDRKERTDEKVCVSLSGDAFLRFVTGKPLPGIEQLLKSVDDDELDNEIDDEIDESHLPLPHIAVCR